jgi:hypothetical protein
VIHVAETEQLEAQAVGAETPQVRLEPASAAQRHHRDSLRVEVASGAARHRLHRGGVGDAFDQDCLLHDCDTFKACFSDHVSSLVDLVAAADGCQRRSVRIRQPTVSSHSCAS